MVTKKVKELRETYGFLPDGDLYEFAELLMSNFCAELKKAGAELSIQQQEILKQYFEKRN